MIADFENEAPDIRQLYSELKANIRRVDRIMKWLHQKYPDDWSEENGG